MGDVLKKVKPGDPLAIPAAKFNTFVAAAQDFLRRQRDIARTPVADRPPFETVLLKNASGADRSRFDVLGIDGPVFTPTDSLGTFTNGIPLVGVTPAASHAGNFAILVEPIQTGRLGRACILGACPAQVHVVSPSAGRAGGSGRCHREVQTVTTNELRLMWGSAVSRSRCFIALALNGSMGQQDISDLRVGEVDWEKGCLKRARSKTGVVARHKLWRVTLKLLKEHRQADAAAEDRVFLGRNGLPLVRRRLVDGRYRHKDAIANAFDRLLKKSGLQQTRKGFYCLRKTGASLVERFDPLAAEMYLAHAQRSKPSLLCSPGQR